MEHVFAPDVLPVIILIGLAAAVLGVLAKALSWSESRATRIAGRVVKSTLGSHEFKEAMKEVFSGLLAVHQLECERTHGSLTNALQGITRRDEERASAVTRAFGMVDELSARTTERVDKVQQQVTDIALHVAGITRQTP